MDHQINCHSNIKGYPEAQKTYHGITTKNEFIVYMGPVLVFICNPYFNDNSCSTMILPGIIAELIPVKGGYKCKPIVMQ